MLDHLNVSGRSTGYGYDEDGRLKCLKDGQGNILTEYRYTAAGRIKEILTPEGMRDSYGYDGDGNLKRLTEEDRHQNKMHYQGYSQDWEKSWNISDFYY